jgi:hypothetical protein
MTSWYTDTEIEDMCAGLTQHAARARYLRSLGLVVTIKPNGRPLVMRGHAEQVLSGLNKREIAELSAGPKPAAQTNRGALLQLFGSRRAAC